MAALPRAAAGQAVGFPVADSRVDLFVGYGYFHPFAKTSGGIPYETVGAGAVFDAAIYPKRWIGIAGDVNLFPSASDDHDCVYSAQVGPAFRKVGGRVVPFGHVLAGIAKVGGPAALPCPPFGWGISAGGGLDWVTPLLHGRLAVRALQVDLMDSQKSKGAQDVQPVSTDGQVTALRISAGLVLRGGGEGVERTEMSCATTPSIGYRGDPILLTASATHENGLKRLQYEWQASGGKINGQGETVRVDTSGLAPGEYHVSGRLLAGRKAQMAAACTAAFTIRRFDPPTLGCAVDQATVRAGALIKVTATARSPQGRSLNYHFALNGEPLHQDGTGQYGDRAEIATDGMRPGTVGVTCSVNDDVGQTASAVTSFTIAEPPAPKAGSRPTAGVEGRDAKPGSELGGELRRMCTLEFAANVRQQPVATAAARSCLDRIAQFMQAQDGSRLVLSGEFLANEVNGAAVLRILNAADYLTETRGINAGRIQMRLGARGSQEVFATLVPDRRELTESDETVLGEEFDVKSIHWPKQGGVAAGKH